MKCMVTFPILLHVMPTGYFNNKSVKLYQIINPKVIYAKVKLRMICLSKKSSFLIFWKVIHFRVSAVSILAVDCLKWHHHDEATPCRFRS